MNTTPPSNHDEPANEPRSLDLSNIEQNVEEGRALDRDIDDDARQEKTRAELNSLTLSTINRYCWEAGQALLQVNRRVDNLERRISAVESGESTREPARKRRFREISQEEHDRLNRILQRHQTTTYFRQRKPVAGTMLVSLSVAEYEELMRLRDAAAQESQSA